MDSTLEVIFSILGPLALLILGWVGTAVRNYFSARAGNEDLKSALVRLETITEDVVRYYLEAHVKSLKRDGIFTPAVAKSIRNEALDRIKTMLAPVVLEYLRTQFAQDSDESLQIFLETKLESMLTRVKSNEQPATTTNA